MRLVKASFLGVWLWACAAPPAEDPAPSFTAPSPPPTPHPGPSAPPSRLPSTPASTVAPAPAPAPIGPCPEDMVLTGKSCIDRYEAPNVAGAKPLRMQSAIDGQAWCEQRGKRLCREDEWVRACRGTKGHDFPYGPRYELGRCNDDKTWKPPRWKALRSWPSERAEREVARLDQSEPSGQRAGCKTENGVFDLTGNVAEWVVRTEDNENNFDHVVKGCYWSRCFRPPHTPSCEYVNFAHRGEERSYEMGFRCCADRTQ